MDEHEYHCKMGRVAAAMTANDTYCGFPLACLAMWIRPAILLKQIHLFDEGDGSSRAYMTWAWLAPDTEQRMLTDLEVVLHPSEWNEGTSLWIMDLVVAPGSLGHRLFEMLTRFPDAQTATSIRRRDDGTIRKVTRWNRQALERRFRHRLAQAAK